MRKEYINAYTGLRGIAAFVIAFQHMHFEDIIPLYIFVPFLNIAACWYPVDIFFMLSGFIIGYVYVPDVSNPKINYKYFLRKRLARIVPLHYLTVFIIGFMAMVALYFGLSTDQPYHLNEIPKQLLMVHAWPYLLEHRWNRPSWYISAIFFAYVFLVPLLLKFVSKMRKNYLLIALSFLVLAIVWALTMGNTSTGWLVIIRVVCQFSIGYLLYSLTTFNNPVSQVASKLVSVWLLLAIFWVFSCWPLPIIWATMHNEFPLKISGRLFQLTTSRMLFEFIFPLLILGLADNKKSLAKAILTNRIFLWLGTISYSIFMIHNLIGKVIAPFVDKIPDAIWIRILIGIGVYVIMLAASWSIYKFFETPTRDYLNKFFSKSKISTENFHAHE